MNKHLPIKSVMFSKGGTELVKKHIATFMRGNMTLIVICLFAATALAQTNEQADATQRNSLVKGAWALQFEIVGDVFDLNLRSFQGTTLSLKKHTSDGSALRIGLGLGLELSDQDVTLERDGESEPVTEYNRDRESISLIIQKVFYPSPSASVNFFYGIGPVADFSHRESAAKLEQPTRKDTYETFSWSAGASGVLGVEWFPTRAISLLAEYSSSLQYSWSKTTRKSLFDQTDNGTVLTVREERDNSLSIQSSSVRLGLSVYF